MGSLLKAAWVLPLLGTLPGLTVAAPGIDAFAKLMNTFNARDAIMKRDIWPNITEWTAVGDSYATGVGSGKVDEFRRCFRFDGAYPRLMNDDAWGRLNGGLNRGDQPPNLNNVACSGATTEDILKEQFRDDEGSDIQYGKRPAFGKPRFATITAGGDDIDFIGLIMNCLVYFFTWRTCESQRAHSWELLKDEKLVDGIAEVIKQTVDKGRKGLGDEADQFKVFVTSYARFFNADTDECDSISWSAWKVDGQARTLSKDLRKDMNDMSIALNGAIAKAAQKFVDQGVVYVDWDDKVDGHRFCEPGITGYGPSEENAWFNYWPGPYGVCVPPFCNPFAQSTEGADAVAKKIDPNVENYEALSKGVDTTPDDDLSITKYPEVTTGSILMALIYEAYLGTSDALQAVGIAMVSTLHPRPPLNERIMDTTFGYFWPVMSPSLDQCHPMKDRFYVEGEKANAAKDDFCKRTGKALPQVYNLGQPNEVVLSVWKAGDQEAPMPPEKECLDAFNSIINLCDVGGDDKDMKWGGTLRGPNTYVYSMTILNQHPDVVETTPPPCTSQDCCPSGCTCGPSGVPLCT